MGWFPTSVATKPSDKFLITLDLVTGHRTSTLSTLILVPGKT